MSVRAFVIDDHPLVQDAMARRFESLPAIDVVGTAADVGTAREALEADAVDVIVLDLRVPGMRGASTIEGLLPLCHGVVLFSSRERDELVERLLRAGASAHVCKKDDLEALDRAILETAHQPSPASSLPRAQEPDRFPHETLSEREFEVYRLLAECKTPKEIAFELGVARSTIYTHTDRIVSKLGVDNAAEVVRYALEFDVSVD